MHILSSRGGWKIWSYAQFKDAKKMHLKGHFTARFYLYSLSMEHRNSH
jgi:hypothetical protein